MIGTRENAIAIATMPMCEDEHADWNGPVPEGFTYLSSGAYRHAFLGPDDVVYKRDVHDDWESDGGNISEWNIYCAMTDMPDGVRLAETYLWETGERGADGLPIIAMEYVPEKSPILADNIRHAIQNVLNIWDVYGNNVRTKNGEVVLTDFAL